ncbi:MAG: hypothetical protein KGJ34_01520 [Patescibacteria group bacterium]|nr:hypothetical protein [Patescibacteria group bacterium]
MQRFVALVPLVFGACLLVSCADTEVKQLTVQNPDGTTDVFNTFSQDSPMGMDVKSQVVRNCRSTPGSTQEKCQVIDVSQGYQRGFVGNLVPGAGTAAVLGTAYAVGQSVRRPDNVSVNNTGGSANNTNNNSNKANAGSGGTGSDVDVGSIDYGP